MPISDEEFQRYQNQLVELKTRNYQLEEQNKKLNTENGQLKSQIDSSKKDSIRLRLPGKLQFSIPGVGRNIEEAEKENETLSRKLHAQEEEFKLQNETMMRELKEYAANVEQLENELKLYKEGRQTNLNASQNGSDIFNQLNEENRRLKAENNVFQKKITELSAKTVESISTASSSNESFQKEDAEVECDDNRSENCLVDIVPSKSINNDTKPFDSYSIRLETEQEEKRLLQEQIRQLDITSNETNTKLLKQIENLKEKLDEKQNTCLQLQRDFEKRIQEIINENMNLKTTNELQIDVLKSDIKRLQDENQKIIKTKDDEVNRYQKYAMDLQATIDQLETQIGTVAAEQNQQLRNTNAKHQRMLEDKELLLHQTILDRDCLRTETERSKEAYETLLQTVQSLEQQVTTKTREYESQKQLTEQRQYIIDEMSQKQLQFEEKAKMTLETQKEKYETDINRLEKEISELKVKDRTLKQYQSRCTELEKRTKADDEIKQDLKTRLEDLQKEKNELEQNYQEQLNEQRVRNEKQFDAQRIEHQEHVQSLTEILSAKAHTIDELNAQIDSLKQETTTFTDEKRAYERKGAALIKDLQKQLTLEKKKNERMQEKLTELLSGDKAALDDLFYVPKSDGSRQGDTGSVSSYGGGGYTDRASVMSMQMSSSTLEQENKELIQKLARVQEERAILDEKVRHLESSNSAMANDLIQLYTTDKRGSTSGAHSRFTTPPSRRRQNTSVDRQSGTALNFRNMFETLSGNKAQATYDDTIKNLQRLLEETLTKNMHLQKDLEAMSLQVQNQSTSNQ